MRIIFIILLPIFLSGCFGETMATFADDGAVTLYHNNVAKLATASDGINVGGTAEEKVGYEMYVLNKSSYEKAFIICGGVGWTLFEDLLDMSKLYPKVRLMRYEDDKSLSFIKNEI